MDDAMEAAPVTGKSHALRLDGQSIHHLRLGEGIENESANKIGDAVGYGYGYGCGPDEEGSGCGSCYSP